MASSSNESDTLERRMLALGAGYALIVAVGLTPFTGWLAALSVPLGSAIALLNAWLLSRGLRALLVSRAFAPFGVFAFVKLSLTGVFLYGLFRAGWVSPLPFVLGLGAVPVALALAQLFQPPPEPGTSRSV